ncbi:hypothetical protein KY289_030684 [Solanum tuberosum]|nr:hypothetical protein KY289_030684 [Solanum tuberosum]
MDFINCVNGLGMELLNHSKTCIESFLVGEYLWDVVDGSNTSPPDDERKIAMHTRSGSRLMRRQSSF